MKPTRKVTYRRLDYPCIILEGYWLTDKYGLEIGDTVKLDFLKDKIVIRTKESGDCEECGCPLPTAKKEVRQGGYSEFVTECPECGATYTD